LITTVYTNFSQTIFFALKDYKHETRKNQTEPSKLCWFLCMKRQATTKWITLHTKPQTDWYEKGSFIWRDNKE